MTEAEIVKRLQRELHLEVVPAEVLDAVRAGEHFKDFERVSPGDKDRIEREWLELMATARAALADYEATFGVTAPRVISTIDRQAVTELEWQRSVLTSMSIANEASRRADVQELRAALPGGTTLSPAHAADLLHQLDLARSKLNRMEFGEYADLAALEYESWSDDNINNGFGYRSDLGFQQELRVEPSHALPSGMFVSLPQFPSRSGDHPIPAPVCATRSLELLDEQIRTTSNALARRYPWTNGQAVWYLVSGETPFIAPVRVRVTFQGDQLRSWAPISVTAQPWVSQDTVAQAFGDAQRRVLSTGAPRRRNRGASERGLELFAFVEEQRRAETACPGAQCG